MTTGVKGFGLENMVIADTSKDKESEVTTTCSDCHYNAYRMLGEEAKKLKEPDERGEHYYPFSQNGKIVQVVTYIQSAYRDGYKHGHKDGYKNGFDDGWVTGRDSITEEQAIAFLQQSGWLENYEDAVVRKTILSQHLMALEEAKDEFKFEQGKLEGRLEVLASIKDLCNSLESEDRA